MFLNRSSDDLVEIFILGFAEVASGLDLPLGEDLSSLARAGLLNLFLELLLGLALWVALGEDLCISDTMYRGDGACSWAHT
jgi:hypothetical protein